jgi:protocatechuate 3,4-dioxygenase beta subunit
MPRSRRSLLHALLALPLLPAAAAAQTAPLALTPACHDGDAPTKAQTEGPYFTPDTPLKRDFAADAPGGERLTIGGLVLDTACTPIDGALVELWHADERGRYDTQGYRLRGHQYADGEGRWWFDTIVPALYPGRTRHYHLKVQRPGGRVLTTQLYFPDEAANARDRIFDAALLLDLRDMAGMRFGRYDFVVA